MEKPPLILIALYYLKSKEGEIPLSYPTLTLANLFCDLIQKGLIAPIAVSPFDFDY